jgi:hypothetical protein
MHFLWRPPCPNRNLEEFFRGGRELETIGNSPHLVVGWPIDEFKPIVILQGNLIRHMPVLIFKISSIISLGECILIIQNAAVLTGFKLFKCSCGGSVERRFISVNALIWG